MFNFFDLRILSKMSICLTTAMALSACSQGDSLKTNRLEINSEAKISENRLRNFVSQPDHHKIVLQKATDNFSSNYNNCKIFDDVQFLPPVADVWPRPPDFGADGSLLNGSLKESVLVKGCGRHEQENVFSEVLNGKLVTGASIPGTTISGVNLISHAVNFIAQNIAPIYAGSCNGRTPSLHISNANFEKFDESPNPSAIYQEYNGRSWWETWYFKVCGKDAQQYLHFIPVVDGIRIDF